MGFASYLEDMIERLEQDLNTLDREPVASSASARLKARSRPVDSDQAIRQRANAVRKSARDLIERAKPLVEILKDGDVALALQIQILEKTRGAMEKEVNSLRKEVVSLKAQLGRAHTQTKFWKDQHDRLTVLRGIKTSPPSRNPQHLTSRSTRTPRKRGAG